MVGITRQAYIEELELLRKEISQMGRCVGDALESAIKSLTERNLQLAKKVMVDDDIVDAMNIAVEDRCMLLIARQQPIAKDLRIIATGLKISTDLERIGDHAHDIAKITADLDSNSFIRKIVDIPKMAEVAGQMLQDSIKAYEAFDVRLAEEVCEKDDIVDELYAKVFQDLSKFIVEDSTTVRQATQLIFVARYLERVADHATNIAEWIIYLVTAERIRKIPRI